MSDESFFREIDQELRQERMKSLWQRYGLIAIAVAVVVILATVGYVGYQYWQEQRSNAAGDTFLAALEHADAGRLDEAMAELRQLEEDGPGAYPSLARMRSAAIHIDAGDFDAAVEAFDGVASDSATPQSLRDVARLRAAYLLVDHGSYDDVVIRAEPLTGNENHLRHSAREALGLAAWNEGESETALAFFEQIVDDSMAPSNTVQRAELMIELIRGSGVGS